MNPVRDAIQAKQESLQQHSFFRALEGSDSVAVLQAFAPELSFWVMAFQDVLRLNEQRVQDPLLRKIARHHRAEDRGHDAWFLQDLVELGVGVPDVRRLFSKASGPTRDCTYALMGELFRAERDVLRIVLLLTLESAGHVFFNRVAAVVERAGKSEALRYFSFSHLEVEKQHAMFEAEMDRQLGAIILSDEERAQALGLVERAYGAFILMFEGLQAAIERPTPTEPALRPFQTAQA